MTYDDLIRVYKTDARAADALGVTRSCVWHWKKKGIPLGRQQFIQLLTNGRLKAEPEFEL